MGKRRNTLSDKLSTNNKNSRPGWQDTIRAQEAVEEEAEQVVQKQPSRKKRNKAVRKTYLLTPDLIERIEEVAEEEQVAINELVRFLIRSALNQIEDGQLVIPTAPGKRKISQ